MLRIRAAQMEQLDREMLERFERDLVAEVTTWEAPETAGYEPDELVTWVRWHVARAKENGLSDMRSLRAYVELVAFHGEAFASDAYVLERLSDPASLDDWGTTRDQLAELLSAVTVAFDGEDDGLFGPGAEGHDLHDDHVPDEADGPADNDPPKEPP